LGITDAQSVKNTDTAKEKGYDGGKLVSGIKRHMTVDSLGLPISIAVTTANVTDRNGAIEMTKLYHDSFELVTKMLVDGGYTGPKFAATIKELVDTIVEVAKRNELHTFAVIPIRWIVERSWAWLEKNRRLWKNCEGLINTSKQMIVLAFIALIAKRG
jgi:transposase